MACGICVSHTLTYSEICPVGSGCRISSQKLSRFFSLFVAITKIRTLTFFHEKCQSNSTNCWQNDLAPIYLFIEHLHSSFIATCSSLSIRYPFVRFRNTLCAKYFHRHAAPPFVRANTMALHMQPTSCKSSSKIEIKYSDIMDIVLV